MTAGPIAARRGTIEEPAARLHAVLGGRVPIDLRAVRAFVLVAEEGSFTRAAGLLFLSQPSLTKIVQQLERDLGCRLLRRSSKRCSLTAHGEAFLPDALDMLAAERSAREALARLSGWSSSTQGRGAARSR